jgi:DNA-binding LytR/AlgR family response regulator
MRLKLPGRDIRRVHRSTNVNLAQVERAESCSHYTYRLHLADGSQPVLMSRRSAARLKEDLG